MSVCRCYYDGNVEPPHTPDALPAMRSGEFSDTRLLRRPPSIYRDLYSSTPPRSFERMRYCRLRHYLPYSSALMAHVIDRLPA